MHETAKELCQRINAANLFGCLGKPIDDPSVVCVKTSDHAASRLTAGEWSELKLKMSNDHGMAVRRISVALFNDMFNCNIIYYPIIKEHISMCSRYHESILPYNLLQSRAGWDLMHALLERYTSDYTAPSFYSMLAEWYINGHIPCGWEGSYPDGKLIIF